MTAHRCLFADGDLRGKKVLVQGGAGAVGLAAILLAKWAGAWVATTVSRANQWAIASAAGADLVINRRDQDVAEVVKSALGGAHIDRIVEVDLMSNAQIDFACLSPSGVISAYATDDPSAELRLPFLRTMFGGYVIRFVFVYTMPEDAKRQAARDISACVATEKYVPAIASRFALGDVAAAHQSLENGDAPGKVLVYPAWPTAAPTNV
ncbi:zinc-binding dehydrogenase [Variovorax sp. AFSI2.2]|uniref:zinc-binding dehydrogenase n=1 Tax=Variovorax sp. AFSI2.2 TaxID=3384160 RepID=UPI003EBCED6D